MAFVMDGTGVGQRPDTPQITAPPTVNGTDFIAQAMASAGSGAAGYSGPGITINPGHAPTRHMTGDGLVQDPKDHSLPTAPITAASPEEAYSYFYSMNEQEREALQAKLFALGLTDGAGDFEGAYKVWQAAVDQAFRFAAVGKNRPLDEMFQMMAASGLAKKDQFPRTTRATSYQLLDPTEAKAAIVGAFQNMMGRNPTEAELHGWISTLQSGVKSHPSITETTVDANGNTTSKQIGDPYDPSAELKTAITDDPEAKAHQAAATLYPALMQALGGN